MRVYVHFKPSPQDAGHHEWTFVSKNEFTHVHEAISLFLQAYNRKFQACTTLTLDDVEASLPNAPKPLDPKKKLSHLLCEDSCELELKMRHQSESSGHPATKGPSSSVAVETMLALAEKHKLKSAWRSAKARTSSIAQAPLTAASVWETVLRDMDPLNVPAMMGLVDLYMQSCKWTKAKQSIQRTLAVVNDPQSPVALRLAFLNAKCDVQLRQDRAAAETLQQVLIHPALANEPHLEHDAKILLAEALYAGAPASQEVALAMLMDLLELSNESDLDAIALYSQIAHDRGKPAEAIQMILKVLVGRAKDKRVQARCAAFLDAPGGIALLHQSLDPMSVSTAAAYAYLATVTKDHGAIHASLACFRQAVHLVPLDATYALNYVHALEVCASYADAFAFVKSFLAANSAATVGRVSCAAIARILDAYATLDDARGSWGAITMTWHETHVRVNGNDDDDSFQRTAAAVDLSPDQLDFLALLCTLVKILFVQGCLRPLPALVAAIEPTRYRCGHLLHTTSIRNEHAYYSCISQLLCIPSLVPFSTRPIYVCGDSHTLATAWRVISVHGHDRVLVPSLVTGLKHWHLRPESTFYPKVNFYNVVQTIPHGADVVFLFGEIDCREGLLLAVEKCRYETLDEGMTKTISIFMDVLQTLVRDRGFRAYVHPIVPVLNETRPIVQQYNAHFKRKVDASACAQWLDFFDALLTPAHKLQPSFELDGTHLHPAYLDLLAHAIERVDK
ncbi:Aste57867_8367 [Aphanomyces stellatus]|uniref:Aste57867_8367 protein n=1 Tax=Aphanomyces stellatus TaxID=120398 RepID=A0A485KK26_9STRA|nr:hypothetical protein As57867_008335 [Aphanomyces stellatus]VFT85253.1 Aste57867_8367 [Aphanomyces stellatus]